MRAAQNVDVIVLALGEGSYCETPGNITDLTIGEPQIKLAEALKATGKPIVMVLVEGRPRIINRIADSASAILMAYNPSNEGGTAIADVLFGDVNPSGKLPVHLSAHAERFDQLRSQTIRNRRHRLR